MHDLDIITQCAMHDLELNVQGQTFEPFLSWKQLKRKIRDMPL